MSGFEEVVVAILNQISKESDQEGEGYCADRY